MPITLENVNGLTAESIQSALQQFAETLQLDAPRRVLLIPPDLTRFHSGGGMLTQLLYEQLSTYDIHCEILPALGSHRAMTAQELRAFFGEKIPETAYHIHNWREDTVEIGCIPAEFMSALSEGRMCEAIPVEVNRRLTEGGYDAIISIGQVVPHEVAGMANYTKNVLVGCGGSRMINASHLLSVFAGTEKWIGRDHSPVRQLFDYAQEHFLGTLPLTYILTVTSPAASEQILNGLYIGGGRAAFDKAVALSSRVNITHTGQPVETCVVALPPGEFRSSWLGNKAIYRTRKALADGARLIILAPGFERFGEDDINDELIRRYGYIGREKLLTLYEQEEALQNNRGALAHLIHGSSDGKFSILYGTPAIYADAIRAVGYTWGDADEYAKQYRGLTAGWNSTPEGDVYFIDNPALGLWEV